MEDDRSNFFESLKQEWKLLWADMDEQTEQGEPQKSNNHHDALLSNSPSELSQLRKRLFQKQERLTKQIELACKRFDVMEKKGLLKQELQSYLDQLQEEGRLIEEEISRINEKLHHLRNQDSSQTAS